MLLINKSTGKQQLFACKLYGNYAVSTLDDSAMLYYLKFLSKKCIAIHEDFKYSPTETKQLSYLENKIKKDKLS